MLVSSLIKSSDEEVGMLTAAIDGGAGPLRMLSCSTAIKPLLQKITSVFSLCSFVTSDKVSIKHYLAQTAQILLDTKKFLTSGSQDFSFLFPL